MTASSQTLLSDVLGTKRMQQKRCCRTSKARSEETVQLPPVLSGFSFWEKQSKKFDYPKTPVLVRPHVSMQVKGTAELLADRQHQLPASGDILDIQRCRAFSWGLSLLASDCKCMRDPKQELPRPALPDPQNHGQNEVVNWLCFFQFFIWKLFPPPLPKFHYCEHFTPLVLSFICIYRKHTHIYTYIYNPYIKMNFLNHLRVSYRHYGPLPLSTSVYIS